jgi:hypothetical protein
VGASHSYVLRRILELKREEATGGRAKEHNVGASTFLLFTK